MPRNHALLIPLGPCVSPGSLRHRGSPNKPRIPSSSRIPFKSRIPYHWILIYPFVNSRTWCVPARNKIPRQKDQSRSSLQDLSCYPFETAVEGSSTPGFPWSPREPGQFPVLQWNTLNLNLNLNLKHSGSPVHSLPKTCYIHYHIAWLRSGIFT